MLLVVVLLGIGAISCLMANLVVVLAWNVARWNAGASFVLCYPLVGQQKRPCDTLSGSDWSVPSSEVVYTLEQVGETKVSQQ